MICNSKNLCLESRVPIPSLFLFFNFDSVFFCSKPWLGFKWLYSWTSDGRQFQQMCDYVHKVADDVIAKRKETLVSVYMVCEQLFKLKYKTRYKLHQYRNCSWAFFSVRR